MWPTKIKMILNIQRRIATVLPAPLARISVAAIRATRATMILRSPYNQSDAIA